MCRVIGSGLFLITILVLLMAVCEAVLPAVFAYVFLGDCIGKYHL